MFKAFFFVFLKKENRKFTFDYDLFCGEKNELTNVRMNFIAENNVKSSNIIDLSEESWRMEILILYDFILLMF